FLASLEDPRLTVLSAGGRGVANARNTGITAARGEWIAFLDDDDLWAPTKLAHQLSRVGPGVGAVLSGAYFVGPDLEVRDRFPAPPGTSFRTDVLVANPLPAGASGVLVRTAIARTLGGFSSRFEPIEDWEYWIRLAQRAIAVETDEELVAYVEHEGGVSYRTLGDRLVLLSALEEEYAPLYARAGVRPGDGLGFWQGAERDARRGGERLVPARVLVERARRFRRPSDLLRAGVLVAGGEGAMSWCSARFGAGSGRPSVAAPAWLERLRDDLPAAGDDPGVVR
ncbi:MAG: glycosyltransferase family 2 protein, partial [Miltoncostaeaceae bacterium]